MNNSPQWQIVNTWLEYLRLVPAVEIVWLKGSMAAGTEIASSDIDIHIVLNGNLNLSLNGGLFNGLPQYEFSTPSEEWFGFHRLITHSGYVIDCNIYPMEKLRWETANHFKVLFSRDGRGMPTLVLPYDNPPAPPLTPAELSQLTIDLAVVMASAPTPILNGDITSALIYLDLYRIELLKLMYRRLGIEYAKGYKHLEKILLEEWQSDLQSTYPVLGEDNSTEIKEVTQSLFDIIGEHLAEACDEADCKFNGELWFGTMETMVNNLYS